MHFLYRTGLICKQKYAQPSKIKWHVWLLTCNLPVAAEALSLNIPLHKYRTVKADLHIACRAPAMLWPCRASKGHVTARPSRDSLWAICPLSASSGYHAEFHEDCYEKHTNPPHNDPYLQL
jgi:hypothetical protein